MRITHVNVGKSRMIDSGGERYETGIYKAAVDERVEVHGQGLANDVVCDDRYHGGPDQAVYLYSVEDYAFHADQLEGALAPGLFGENLTTSGLELTALCVGDRLRSSQLTLEVTAPRIPCNTLEARVGRRGFAKAFLQARRSGAYCRVISEGSVGVGDEFELVPFRGDRILLTTFFEDMTRKLTIEELQRYLALPIDERNRSDFEAKVKAAG